MHFKTKGRQPYYFGMIRYALYLTYTSTQSAFIFENFLLLFLSFLHKIQQRGVDSLKSVALLREQVETAKLYEKVTI